MFKLNQQIIWIGNDNNTLEPLVEGGTVTKIGKDTIWINGQHKAEDQIYAAFCYPDTEECRSLLNDTIEMGKRHKAEDKAMISRQYQVSNEMVRQGLK